jgi:hypothetical protein
MTAYGRHRACSEAPVRRPSRAKAREKQVGYSLLWLSSGLGHDRALTQGEKTLTHLGLQARGAAVMEKGA